MDHVRLLGAILGVTGSIATVTLWAWGISGASGWQGGPAGVAALLSFSAAALLGPPAALLGLKRPGLAAPLLLVSATPAILLVGGSGVVAALGGVLLAVSAVRRRQPAAGT